jgi:hypothetical protein
MQLTDSEEIYGITRVHTQLARWGTPCGPELLRGILHDYACAGSAPPLAPDRGARVRPRLTGATRDGRVVPRRADRADPPTAPSTPRGSTSRRAVTR